MTVDNELTGNLPSEFGDLSDTLKSCYLSNIRVWLADCHVSFWKSSTHIIAVSQRVNFTDRQANGVVLTDTFNTREICIL